MAESLKNRTFRGVIWSGIERFSVHGVHFLVTLVIARILDPSDFGLVGMLAIFIAVSQSLIDSGFSQALIRKQNRTNLDNSTVFYFNIIVSLCLYFLLFAIAPLVSSFYEEPQLLELMRVLCLVVVINSFAVVQRAIYTASIDFKTQAKASLISAIVSGGIAIYLAINGYGVWTLVWQQILNAIINTSLLWFFSSWRPLFIYSWSSFRELFAFGSKLLASGLIDTIYRNMYTLVIGKVFSATNLGQYTQANHFVQLPSSNITGILQRVTYPVLCTLQNDDVKLRDNYRKLIRLSAFIVFPLMCILAGVSYPLVTFLIGEKWHFAATMIIPLSLAGMWYPVHAINLNLLQVKGRSDLFLRLEIIKKIIGVVILVLSIPFGLLFMCWSSILTSLLCLFINTYYTGKLINVGFLTQMHDLSGTLVTSLIVFAVSFFITTLISSNFWGFLIASLIGAGLFLLVVQIFHFQEFDTAKSIILSKKNG
ncbi:MAG: lipopolysaccharide biosynthesis protein [Bacteroidaceae bacterium]|nr:lipopolysaccharide biosynthesis protein [Bacteroidaceae bacterium]